MSNAGKSPDAANQPPELRPEWEKLAQHLRNLLESIEQTRHGEQLELNQFAGEFQRMAHAYHEAIRSAGKTSIRIRAMLKALDLKTPKSAVERFLES